MVLMGLSIVAYGLGDASLSALRAEESLARRHAPWGIRSARPSRSTAWGGWRATGVTTMTRRRPSRKRSTSGRALTIGSAIVQPLAGLAELASVYGQPETAATLAGVVDALAQEAGDFILERCIYFAGDNRDRAIERAGAALGEERCAELRAAGRALPLEEAVHLAAAVTTGARPASLVSSPTAGLLTPREREVLRSGRHRTDRSGNR